MKGKSLRWLVALVGIIGAVAVLSPLEAQQNPFTLFGFGANVNTNSGNKSANTLRVVLATDQPTMSNAQPMTVASLPLPTGAALDSSLTTLDTDLKANVTLHAGTAIVGKVGIDQTTPGTTNAVAATNFPTTVDTNSGNKGASTLRAVIATDALAIALWGHGVVGSAVPANATQMAGTDGTNLTVPYIDPCQRGARTRFMITQTAGAQLIAGTSAKNTYICDLDFVSATAQNVALVSGTVTVCGTGTHAMAGGTTAGTGWNLAANGGLVKAGGGFWVYATTTAADNVCLLQSSSGQVSGSGSYVQY